MENLELYNALRTPPPEALKPIQAGRMKGKTDINPMWRMKALTEVFGPCGMGWTYEITRQWLENGPEGEISAFCNILLFYKLDGEWSRGIPGTGGSAFVTREKSGLYQSDECYKMALTDAISVAAKALGMAADVYWQNDPSKYDRPQDPPPGPVCDRCGARILPVKGKDGKIRTVEQVTEYSLKTYDHILCLGCQKHERESARAAG